MLDIPYLDQYFGVWAIREADLHALHQQFLKLDIAVHLGSPAVAAIRDRQGSVASYQRDDDGIASFDISGKLMKQETSLGGTSTVAMRRAVRAAANDPQVRAGFFRFDSPGGTVAGTPELGDDIAAFSAAKPSAAFIEDMGASAAYWLASQCPVISTNRAGMVGSIGTYGVVLDMSGAASQKGVVVHVVKAGDYKGAGEPGTKVTPEQLAELQKIIDDMNGHFLAAVSSGRKMPMSRVQSLADGRVHVGAQAVALGLADYVEPLDAAYNRLRSLIAAPSPVTRPTYQPSRQAAAVVPQATAIPIALDPVQEFSSLVKAQMRVAQCDRASAVAFVASRAPRLHADYVAATGSLPPRLNPRIKPEDRD